MVKVGIVKNGLSYRLHARDHAYGSDQVCAAVSGLLYGLAGYLANRDDLKEDIELKPGRATIAVQADEEDPALDAVFIYLAIAMLQIEESYPDYIKVKMCLDGLLADTGQ